MTAAPYPAVAAGDHLGIGFPTTIEALLDQGAPFLTRAFRATGALGADGHVAEIVEAREFFGGGMGRKLLLSVRYGAADTGLPERLFVKFPRDFGDPLRDLFTPPMEPEVRFALLSRRPGFPVPVPRCLFADYDRAMPAGIIMTERIAFGNDGIEPAHDKCMDDRLDDPLGHYQALVREMGRLAGAHRAGALGADVAAQFPFDPADIAMGAIPFDDAGLSGKLALLRGFAAAHPQLFPDGLGDPGFLDRFSTEAMDVLAVERGIRLHLNAQTDLIALCHWNMNVDNAWFWRDADGVLRTGLLDWGSVGQMNLGQAFFGMTCAAEPGFLHAHRDGLLALLTEEYARNGGPAVPPPVLAEQLKLAIAVLGVAWMLDAPTIIAREVPDVDRATGPRDPLVRDNFLARAQLQLLLTFLGEWRALDIGEAVRGFADATGGGNNIEVR